MEKIEVTKGKSKKTIEYEPNELLKNINQEAVGPMFHEFMNTYMEKGFGVMNKTDIEILLYHIIKKYMVLDGKCFSDSFKLKITEAKARRLIYEAQVKYSYSSDEEMYKALRKYVTDKLISAPLVFEGGEKKVKLCIDDKYMKVALNAKLRANNEFADTSFNSDIIVLNKNAFIKLCNLFIDNTNTENVLKSIKDKIEDAKLKEEIEGITSFDKCVDAIFEKLKCDKKNKFITNDAIWSDFLSGIQLGLGIAALSI